MYVCPNCNYQSATPMHFCFNCGAKTVYIENQQPNYQQPPYQQQYQQSYQQYPPYQQTPRYYEPPRPSNLGKKIPSIILGAIGFMFAIINVLYTLIFLSIEPEAGFVFALVFSCFSLPLCIVGKVLSNKCKDYGDDSKSAGVGGGFGVAGIIICAILLFVSFVSMA